MAHESLKVLSLLPHRRGIGEGGVDAGKFLEVQLAVQIAVGLGVLRLDERCQDADRFRVALIAERL